MDHTIEVENIIRKVIITAGPHPAAVAVTSAIRCDDPTISPVLFPERFDEEAPAARLI
jgi:hypothetical protein